MSNKAINEKLVRQAPTSVEALKELLFEGLGWPKPASMSLEDIPLIDWEPAELHLDPAAVAKLTKIQQLPRLNDSQPFGVFILSFEGGGLPVGAVRLVVDRLIRKKRAQKNTAKALWDLSDLIFFCQSDAGVSTLHVVAFHDTGALPVMKVISWTSEGTDNRIELVASEYLPFLSWPETKIDVATWRNQWESAFTATYRQGVKTASALAQRMADVARTVRDEVNALYAVENEDGPLKLLFNDVRSSLREDMTPTEFADMYAQTMVYGLLASRITHPEDFQADAVSAVLRFDNPFLDALYESFRETGDGAFDVDNFGLRDLGELLARTDVEEILADFGTDSYKDDPVVFFYEEFLSKYDAKQKKELGTYYTPIPVVRCIVRAVDHIIKTDFGLPEGVADQTTWAEYSKRTGIKIPAGSKPTDPVIRVLDPATGTGTFLLEWYRQGVANLGKDATDERKEAIARQMDAFEISLSSYAVAHLKTGLELPPSVRAKNPINIRLTDSLAGRRELNLLDTDPIALEGQAAEKVKFETNHSIVIGNPPYLKIDAASAGGWIAHPDAGMRAIFEDFLEPARKNTIFSHIATLYDLYAYFWRFAMWKAFEQHSDGPGVVGFITASSWLSAAGFMGARQLARRLADEIYVIDLGGEGRGAVTEENIFPIQSAVSIVLLVRRGARDKGLPAIVRYSRLRGSKLEKLGALAHFDLGTNTMEVIEGGWLDEFTPSEMSDAWASCPALADLLPWQQPGCKWNRTWPVAPSALILEQRWDRFLSTDDAEDRATCFATATTGRNIITKVGDMPRLLDLQVGAAHQPIVRCGWRSFDRQWTFEDRRLTKTDSPSLWASRSAAQVFLASKMRTALGDGAAVTVFADVPDLSAVQGSFGGKDVMPMFRDAGDTPNVDPALLAYISERLGIFVSFNQFFAYIFAMLGGTDYRLRFADDLANPGPRVPLTSNPDLFSAIASLGEQLLWLQTFGERFGDGKGDFSVSEEICWSPEPSRIASDTTDFKYDAMNRRLLVADGVLEGVLPEVWAFAVSGMPVLKKWLGYRTAKGTGKAASSSSPLDKIRPTEWEPEWSFELREVVHVLTETLRLQPEGISLLDRVLDGPLISADELPQPPDELRKPPKASAADGNELDFED